MSKPVGTQLDACLADGKYYTENCTLSIWVPSTAHAQLWATQATEIENSLQKLLNHPGIRVRLLPRKEAFPEVERIHTSEERWQALRRINPLVEELQRRSKGKILPYDVERYFSSQQTQSTQKE
ncbi:MAG: hypothetical protein NZ580_04885 [Bacteroidia bacterium]|nr:hypothetical protein [Bacteroidia bacterium]MDW8236104.1 hypothetical protein [Bacteroidia bacterium]